MYSDKSMMQVSTSFLQSVVIVMQKATWGASFINQRIKPLMLLQVPYRLHAVLVHEGQANAGHYWAYIYDPHQRCWMKYNDISVTKSSWEELVRDSFGGYRNASAYCLMYINDKKPFLIEGTCALKISCL